MPNIPLPVLLSAVRSIVAPLGAVPKVSTLDGETWQCLAVDVETLSHADALPTGVASSAEGAASMMLDALHDAGLEADEIRAANLRTLRDAFPAGVTIAAPSLADELRAVG